MSIHFIGESSAAAPPFDSLFFKSAFEQIVERGGKSAQKLTLYLSDGTMFDVCEIVELGDAFMVVRGYKEATDTCELALNVLPYGLIYRLELGPKANEGTRVGFKWTPPATITKGRTGIRRK
ncbi:MAG TPA: hypothetical protein VFC90_07090 [Planctomycetota bacterium]|nr:hypothetical protein [Planctomycetota bacterium]